MPFEKIPINPGRVYILRNPLYQDALVKIGYTKDRAETRAKNLSSPSGVPYQFEVLYEEEVADCTLAEQLIHRELDLYRVQARREFFQLPLKLAVRTVFQVCLRVNRELIPERGRLTIWLNSSEKSLAQELNKLLSPAQGGNSTVHLVYKNAKAECHLMLNESCMVHCTPELLTKLSREPWVQEVFLHTPLE